MEIVAAAEGGPAGAGEVTRSAETEQQSGPQVEGDPLALHDDNSNGRITCTEARRHGIAPMRSDHPAYRYMWNPDGDGVVCE